MELKSNFNPVVRNIQNEDAYFYLGENRFQNIRTGKEGIVSDEVAQKIFKINLEATEICGEHPIIAEMIKVLNLRFYNTKK